MVDAGMTRWKQYRANLTLCGLRLRRGGAAMLKSSLSKVLDCKFAGLTRGAVAYNCFVIDWLRVMSVITIVLIVFYIFFGVFASHVRYS